MEVGEYIRTTKGKIEKVKTIHNTRFTDHSKMAYIKKYKEMAPESRILYNGHILIRDIVKHSKDIIDLIEVGDIVNGCVVVAEKYTYIEMNFINVDSEISYGWGTGAIPENEIKSILTHEMYEQNCYKVGED